MYAVDVPRSIGRQLLTVGGKPARSNPQPLHGNAAGFQGCYKDLQGGALDRTLTHCLSYCQTRRLLLTLTASVTVKHEDFFEPSLPLLLSNTKTSSNPHCRDNRSLNPHQYA